MTVPSKLGIPAEVDDGLGGAWIASYSPTTEALLGRRYYQPSDSGYEQEIQNRLKYWDEKRHRR